jgi:hypothetical protein
MHDTFKKNYCDYFHLTRFYILVMTSNISLELFSHENLSTLLCPLALSLIELNFNSAILWTISSILYGSQYIPDSVKISFNDGMFDNSTGQSQACASKGGIPNPSYNDGYINPIALL